MEDIRYSTRQGQVYHRGVFLGLSYGTYSLNLLHLVPVEQAFEDDITLSVIYKTQDEAVTATHFNILQKDHNLG